MLAIHLDVPSGSIYSEGVKEAFGIRTAPPGPGECGGDDLATSAKETAAVKIARSKSSGRVLPPRLPPRLKLFDVPPRHGIFVADALEALGASEASDGVSPDTTTTTTPSPSSSTTAGPVKVEVLPLPAWHHVARAHPDRPCVGAFATEDVRKWGVIAEYAGKWHTEEEYELLKSSPVYHRYAMEFRNGGSDGIKTAKSKKRKAKPYQGAPDSRADDDGRRNCIVDATEAGNATREMNHYADRTDDVSGNVRSRAPNARFVEAIDRVTRRPHVFVVALAAIARGEEVTVDYGANYFEGAQADEDAETQERRLEDLERQLKTSLTAVAVAHRAAADEREATAALVAGLCTQHAALVAVQMRVVGFLVDQLSAALAGVQGVKAMAVRAIRSGSWVHTGSRLRRAERARATLAAIDGPDALGGPVFDRSFDGPCGCDHHDVGDAGGVGNTGDAAADWATGSQVLIDPDYYNNNGVVMRDARALMETVKLHLMPGRTGA